MFSLGSLSGTNILPSVHVIHSEKCIQKNKTMLPAQESLTCLSVITKKDSLWKQLHLESSVIIHINLLNTQWYISLLNLETWQFKQNQSRWHWCSLTVKWNVFQIIVWKHQFQLFFFHLRNCNTMMYINPFNEALHMVLVAMKISIFNNGRKSQISTIFHYLMATESKWGQ